MTLDVNSLHCSVVSIMRVVRLRLESSGFRYKVPLCLSYLHIKFDDEIHVNSFEFQTYFPIRLRPKLNWRLGLALFAPRFRSYWDLFHKSMANK